MAFLVEWMGLEEMRSGAGVLDVAGGSGLVTFELVRAARRSRAPAPRAWAPAARPPPRLTRGAARQVFRRGVNTTCVDPRPLKLSAKQRRAMQWRRERAMQMPDELVADAPLPPNFQATLSSRTARLGRWGWEGAPDGEPPAAGEEASAREEASAGEEASARLTHLAAYFDHSFGEQGAPPPAVGGAGGVGDGRKDHAAARAAAAAGGGARVDAGWLVRECSVTPPPPPPLRTKWTRRVPHPVLIGHAASLTPY